MVALKRTHRSRSMTALVISITLHLCIIALLSSLVSKKPIPAVLPTRVSIRASNSRNGDAPSPKIVHPPQKDKVPIDAPGTARPSGPQPEPATVTAPQIAESLPEFTDGPSAGKDEATEAPFQDTLAPESGSEVQPLHGFSEEAKADPAIATGTEFKRLFVSALVFPETARRAGRSGAVSLIVGVGVSGTIESVRITASSGSALLDSAARAAAESIEAVPPPGRRLELAIRAVFTAGKASLSP